MTLDIKHKFVIDAAPGRLFESLTDGRHISKWWTTESSLEPRTGAQGVFVWREHGWKVELVLTKLVASSYVEMECTASNMQETNAWEGSRLLFSISPAENGSALEFKQTGYKQSPCHKVCTAGWHFVLGKSLKAYLETGKGMPYESKMM